MRCQVQLNVGYQIFELILKKYAYKKYLRFKNWYQKTDSVLDSEDRKVFDELWERSSKKKTIVKLKELIKLLKDEEWK